MNSSDSKQRGVVAVIARQGRLLVIRRSRFVAAPRSYCFPGGGIRTGETAAEALVRELDEELGVQIAPQRRLWSSIAPWDVALDWWLADLPAAERLCPNAEEVEAVHWLRPDELLRLPDLLASNRAFLDAWRREEFRLPV